MSANWDDPLRKFGSISISRMGKEHFSKPQYSVFPSETGPGFVKDQVSIQIIRYSNEQGKYTLAGSNDSDFLAEHAKDAHKFVDELSGKK